MLQAETKVLVCLSWGFQLVVLANLLLLYNAYPDQHETSWELRFRWIAQYICCGILQKAQVREQVCSTLP